MINLLKEKENLWDYLSNQSKPIVIYGMGDGAIKIMNVCKDYGIEISEIFASDDHVRGNTFLEYKVKTLAQVQEKYDDFIILLAFAAFEEGLMNKIYTLAEKHELYAPDVPVFGSGLFTLEYIEENEIHFDFVYNKLSDDYSKKVYTNLLNFKVSGKIDYLKDISTTRSQDYTELLPLSDGITYVDLGAYDGDTINEILSHNITPDRIIAFEPDPKNYRKLVNNTQEIPHVELHNIGSYNCATTLSFNNKAGRNSAFGSDGKHIEIPVNSVDNILNGSPAHYIKMDVEGAEYATILGCKETMVQYKPAMGIAAYHRNEDLFKLAELVLSINPNYELYIRHNHYIPAWESIFYAI